MSTSYDPQVTTLAVVRQRIADLANRASELASELGEPEDFGHAIDTQRDRLEVARRLRRMMRVRDDVFGAEHFADPRWTALLYLYEISQDGEVVSATDLARRCGVPASTMLRHVYALCDGGLIESVTPSGLKRPLYRITEESARRMEKLINAALSSTFL